MERVAPPGLEGRREEVEELAKFCTSPATAGTYAWWRGEPWSGKTALMSWFVLHPPSGVRLVSFFVTARYAAQNDRHAFIENVMEQLLALLGMEWPPGLGASRYESNLLGLLTEAADACSRRGEHFVLLVDGLDEDRSVHVGSDSYSIAALLPATLPAGMRVIFTGRPHPPIPADVPPEHPLRDATIVRWLEPSPRAQAIRVEMERDLKRLLEATNTEQDVLGLVTAAGGGLSAYDLAELTGGSRRQIHEYLRCVTGRSFSVRDSHIYPDRSVYVLGHEEIQATALELLGPVRLDAYRQRLHTWAEQYRDKQWPSNTPEYPLRGYFRMLTAIGDTTRMVAYATDRHRHDRMLNVSGGDAIALSEIRTTQEILAAQDDPDLCAMVRLTIHRGRLTNRNIIIPDILPVVWARLGNFNRAEAIANSIVNPIDRIKALTSVASATAESGDRIRAARLVDDAEQFARTVAGHVPGNALARIAGAAAETGDFDRAEQIARTITDDPTSNACAEALAQVAGVVAEAGNVERAERIAHSITDEHSYWKAEALARIAGAVAETGDFDRAERIADTITCDLYRKAKALARIAGAVAEAGDLYRAEQIAHTITDDNPSRKAEALARAAGAAPDAGESGRATRLLHNATQLTCMIKEPGHREEALAWVTKALVMTGDFDGAEQIAHTLAPYHEVLDVLERVLAQIAETIAEAGDFDRAEQIAHTISGLYHAPALERVAGAIAEAGDVERAERIAHTFTDEDSHSKAGALARIAGAVAKAGDSGHAARLLHNAERIARTTTEDDFPESRAQALVQIARAVAEAGDFDRAEQIAHTITGRRVSYARQGALIWVAVAVAKAGDFDRAERITQTLGGKAALAPVAVAVAEAGELDRAEQIAQTLDEYSLMRVAVAVAEAGDLDRAERIAYTITDRLRLVGALAGVAEAGAKAGESRRATRLIDNAEQIAHTITDRHWRVYALADVAEAGIKAGESRRATRLIDNAEQIAHSITDRLKASALAQIVGAIAKAGEFDRAEQIAHTITGQYHAPALERVAEAVAEAGDFDRAEQIAHAMTQGWGRAHALVRLAQNRSVPRRSHLIADVLRLEDWYLAVEVLAELVPASTEVILTELTNVGLARIP